MWWLFLSLLGYGKPLPSVELLLALKRKESK